MNVPVLVALGLGLMLGYALGWSAHRHATRDVLRAIDDFVEAAGRIVPHNKENDDA